MLETTVAREALRSVENILLPGWSVELEDSGAGSRSRVVIVGPRSHQQAEFVVVTRRGGLAAAVVMALARDEANRTGLPVLYLSDYIGPSLRNKMVSENFSYADGTGWVSIAHEDPLLLLTGRGAEKSPSVRTDSTISRLNGVAVGRIIRTLCENEAPLGVRELASLAGVSPGSVSKLLPTLALEGVVDREESGKIITIRRRALIERWVQDYSFEESNRALGYYLAPRGIDAALETRKQARTATTLTGSAAARRLLPAATIPVVPLRLLAFYSPDPLALANELSIVETDPSTANIVIAVPQDSDVLDAELAPVGLVIADLLTLPGRGEAEAQQLMRALADTDPSWR